jgi:hypothetical protein
MATGVNVKMGVSGIAQFKQNMATARNSLKTVDEQLKLNEKQFKATGDSEAYMQQKSELLKTKLDEQKAIVEQAEKALAHMTSNGVEKSSKAFQDMQQQLARAQGELLDTNMQIQGIESSSDDAAAGVGDLVSELNGIGNQVSLQTVTDGIDSITDKMKEAAKRAFDLGRRIVQATLGAGSWADEIATEAGKAGLSTKDYQQMMAVSNLIDTGFDSIISGRQRLSQAMESESEEAEKIFAQLGVEAQRYGRADDLTDVFWETGEALMKINNEAEQNVMGKKLFGNWRELIPLFTAGREEYEKLKEEQSYVDDESLESLTKMDDQYQKMTHEWEVFKMEMLTAFSGPLTEGMETITGLFEELNKYLQSEEGQAMLTQLGETISGLITDLTDIDPEQVVGGLQAVINGIKDSLEWIDKNRETVVNAMKAIVAGWAGLKLTGGALDILNLVNGVKTLKNGGKIAGVGAAAAGASKAAGAAAGAAAGTSWVGAFAAVVAKAVPILAFLYTLGNPAGSATDDWDSLEDEYGNPTAAARELEELRKKDNGILYVPDSQEEAAKSHGTLTDEERKLAEKIYDNWNDDDMAVELMDQLEELMGSDRYKILEDEIFKLMQREDWGGPNLPADFFSSVEEQLPQDAEVIGENTVTGLANGINNTADEAIRAAEDLAAAVRNTIEQSLKIGSPSRVMMELGEFVSAGFAEGIEDGLGQVNRAVYSMASAATSVPSRSDGGRTIDVTLMIGPDKLTEVIVPLVDSSMGEEINLMRR